MDIDGIFAPETDVCIVRRS